MSTGTSTRTHPRRRDAAATREQLLAAARARFADHGYGGTTLRQVAGDVGVNPALVIRYFDSKERLFLEALGPRPHLGDVADVPLDELGPELVRRAIVELRSGQSGQSLLALLHSQSTELGLSRLRTVIVGDFADVLGARLAGPSARARAVLVGAQLLGLSLVTEVFRRPGDVLMPIEEVVAIYGPAIQAVIDQDA